MEAFICVACGAQYPPSVEPPQVCPGCVDERQAFPVGGQQWTTLSRVHHTRFTVFREHEPNVIGIGTEPKLGIGQRAVLVQTEHGNILWDLTPYIDETTVQIINGLGGIQTIAISHPHFYTTMHDWSEAFDNAPIYLHEADRDFVRRSSPNIRFWDGESHELVPGATLIQAGGHFAGGTMMHWAPGAEGKGVLFSSDMMYITPDNQFVTFMRGYPTLIPLSADGARAVAASADGYAYDRIYGHFFGMEIRADAQHVVADSLDRYIAAVEGKYDAESGNPSSRARVEELGGSNSGEQ